MAVEAVQTGKVSGQSLLEVAYAERAAGIAPEPESWKSMVGRIDPEMAARAARAALSPDDQTRLNDDARSGAVDHREPEPSLRVER